jgi:hypothetical protein
MAEPRHRYEVRKRDARGRLRSVLFEHEHDANGFAEDLAHSMALRGRAGSVHIVRGEFEDLVYDVSAEDEPDGVAAGS